MYILIMVYFLVLLLEGAMSLEPIAEFGDFTISYNLLMLVAINVIFMFRYLVKPFKLPFNNPIAWFYGTIFITFIPVLLFKNHLALGGLSLLGQFFLQSMIILVLFKSLRLKTMYNFTQFLGAFAFINCLIVYGSYYFPDTFKGIAEIHGYFGFNDDDPDRIKRVFGIMGDVAPWFLSFFALHAIQMKKYFLGIFFGMTCALGASIGATALLLFGVYLHFFLSSLKKTHFFIRTLIFIVVILGIILFYFPDMILNISVVKRLIDPSTFKSYSGAQRLFTFGLALDMINASPIWGNGYGTFLYNLQSSFGYQFFNLKFEAGALSNANNQFLQILYEGGIVLFTFFIFMIRHIFLIFNKYVQWSHKQSKMLEFKKSAFIWLISLVLINQTAVWMIPSLLWLLISSLIGISLYINKNIHLFENITLNSIPR